MSLRLPEVSPLLPASELSYTPFNGQRNRFQFSSTHSVHNTLGEIDTPQPIRNYSQQPCRNDTMLTSSILSAATHADLMQAQNVTYIEIHQCFAQAEKELLALCLEIQSLQSQKESYINSYQMLVNAVPELLNVTNPQQTTCSAPLQQDVFLRSVPSMDTLNWPEASQFSQQQLDKMFWSKARWKENARQIKGVTCTSTKKKGMTPISGDFNDDNLKVGNETEELEIVQRGKSRAAADINVNMLYVVDENGTPIGRIRAGEIQSLARSIWAWLLSKGMAPRKWKTDTNVDINRYFRYEMAKSFPELRLCELGWKADQIACDFYPSWYSNRKSAEKPVKLKQETDNANLNQESIEVPSANLTSPSHKRKPSLVIDTSIKKARRDTSASPTESPGEAGAGSLDTNPLTASNANVESAGMINATQMGNATTPTTLSIQRDPLANVVNMVSDASHLEVSAPPEAKPVSSDSTQGASSTVIERTSRKKTASAKVKITAADCPLEIKEGHTARTFGAREYIAANPQATNGEFKLYWDALSALEKKKFVAIEKAAKATALLATTSGLVPA